MKLKQALKRKNKLVSLVNQEMSKVIRFNSIVEGTECPYNVEESYNTVRTLTDELIDLKSKISKANTPVQDKIYRLSELKSLTKNLKGLSCEHGKQVANRWDASGDPVHRVATFKTLERDKMVEDLENEIEQIQDELDYFNQVTEI